MKNRHSVRLKGFDYANDGWYFVTICTQNRTMLFGDVVDGKMELNKMGKIVKSIWQSLPDHHPVKLDQFQIMPNHVHMIIIIWGFTRNWGFARKTPTYNIHTPCTGVACNAPIPPISGSLSCIIRSFKSEITKQIRIIIDNPQFPVWQRNYYEHIIRNEIELFKIREYIKLNPEMWERDRNNLHIPA